MSYQQYFVVIALVIPVFYLAHIVQFRESSTQGAVKTKEKLVVLYNLVVLGSSVLAEGAALQLIWTTGLPTYAEVNWPDESLTAAKQWMLALVGLLIFGSLAPALFAGPKEKLPAHKKEAIPALDAQLQASQPAGSGSAARTMMAVGLTSLFTAALMVRGQMRQHKKR
ncbi:hypothetical protein [Arthrobacter sp. B1I2]|uniref:hypothetical protein n=1 Tax=Arthrobacter sp. B1I2 TaxID=3042263 RepID=UPI00278050AC|nr:hypothetical protein [Arthrobacter sp. B1I2]MDQ0731783.1 hypothetical protein [Arthrobacter sp. B1I2]